jgi:RNA polymerase sigma-70 factor (ECF subfamily)
MDESAYRALVDRLQLPLSKFVARFVHDPHAVEDLVQETHLRVFRNLHRYRGRASVKTWVFSIARNLCLDHLRAAGRSRLRLVDAPEPAAAPRDDERRARVEHALARLDPQTRTLLVLWAWRGLSYRQIARRCGVSPTGMSRRLARAREGFSKNLA